MATARQREPWEKEILLEAHRKGEAFTGTRTSLQARLNHEAAKLGIVNYHAGFAPALAKEWVASGHKYDPSGGPKAKGPDLSTPLGRVVKRAMAPEPAYKYHKPTGLMDAAQQGSQRLNDAFNPKWGTPQGLHPILAKAIKAAPHAIAQQAKAELSMEPDPAKRKKAGLPPRIADQLLKAGVSQAKAVIPNMLESSKRISHRTVLQSIANPVETGMDVLNIVAPVQIAKHLVSKLGKAGAAAAVEAATEKKPYTKPSIRTEPRYRITDVTDKKPYSKPTITSEPPRKALPAPKPRKPYEKPAITRQAQVIPPPLRPSEQKALAAPEGNPTLIAARRAARQSDVAAPGSTVGASGRRLVGVQANPELPAPRVRGAQPAEAETPAPAPKAKAPRKRTKMGEGAAAPVAAAVPDPPLRTVEPVVAQPDVPPTPLYKKGESRPIGRVAPAPEPSPANVAATEPTPVAPPDHTDAINEAVTQHLSGTLPVEEVAANLEAKLSVAARPRGPGAAPAGRSSEQVTRDILGAKAAGLNPNDVRDLIAERDAALAREKGAASAPQPDPGAAAPNDIPPHHQAAIEDAVRQSLETRDVPTAAKNLANELNLPPPVDTPHPNASPSERTYEMKPEEVTADPSRFQFKSQTDETGATNLLKGVDTWDPDKGGIISVWKDPADGNAYVVNGHHRLELARRLGVNKVQVQFLDAPTAEAARAKGALINISEGRGTPIDVAKLIRDGGYTAQSLRASGVSLQESLAKNGLALSKLPDEVFHAVVSERLPMDLAAAIGGSGLNDSGMNGLFKMVNTELDKGKLVTPSNVRNMQGAFDVAGNVVSTGPVGGLFDDLGGTQEVSLVPEKARIMTALQKILGGSKREFGTVSKAGAAERLAAGGNTIDAATSKALSDEAAQHLERIQAEAHMAGTRTSDILNQAAQRVHNGENVATVAEEILPAIRGDQQTRTRMGAPAAESSDPRDFMRTPVSGADPFADQSPTPALALPDVNMDPTEVTRGASEAGGSQLDAYLHDPTGGFDTPDPQHSSPWGSETGAMNLSVLGDVSDVAKKAAADLHEGLNALVEGLSESMVGIASAVAPRSVAGKPGQLSAEALTEGNAFQRMRDDRAAGALRETNKTLHSQGYSFSTKTPDTRLVNVISAIETGQGQVSPELDAAAAALRQVNDTNWNNLVKVKPDAAQHYVDNYLAHTWKNPKRAQDFIDKWVKDFTLRTGRAPFQGDTSWMKDRSHDLFVDGLKAGLEPVSMNPVDLTLDRTLQINKYIKAHEWFNEMKGINWIDENGQAQKGLVRFVKYGTKAPEGYVKLNDRMFNVEYKNANKEFVKSGDWYAPSGAALPINNYLSPTLRSSAAFRGYMGIKNLHNAFQLSMSGFHLGFIAVDSFASDLASAVSHLAQGEPKEALKSALGSPAAVVTNFKRGQLVDDAWRFGAPGGPLQETIEALLAGGGAAGTDEVYLTHIAKTMAQKWSEGSYLTAGLMAPPALVEAATEKLIYNTVAKAKLGLFMKMSEKEYVRLAEHFPNVIPREVLRKQMGEIWRSVENRMGQMAYDNLFWKNWAKDVGIGSFRALGFHMGTVREVGGGYVDLLHRNILPAASRLVPDTKYTQGLKSAMTRGKPLPYESPISHRTAYLGGLHVAHGILSGIGAAIYYAAHNRHYDNPTAKDYVFPRTGGEDEAGNPERGKTADYVANEYAVGTGHGGELLRNAMDGFPGAVLQHATNQDRSGVQISRPGDPRLTQLKDHAVNEAWNWAPFSYTNAKKMYDRGDSLTTSLAPMVGFTPAPAYVNRSPLDNYITSVSGNRSGVITREQADNRQMTRQLISQGRKGKDIGDAVIGMFKAGVMSKEAAKKAYKRTQEAPIVERFRAVSQLDDAITGWTQHASPEQQKQLWFPMAQKLIGTQGKTWIRGMKEPLRAPMMEQLQAALKTATDSKGENLAPLSDFVVKLQAARKAGESDRSRAAQRVITDLLHNPSGTR